MLLEAREAELLVFRARRPYDESPSQASSSPEARSGRPRPAEREGTMKKMASAEKTSIAPTILTPERAVRRRFTRTAYRERAPIRSRRKRERSGPDFATTVTSIPS